MDSSTVHAPPTALDAEARGRLSLDLDRLSWQWAERLAGTRAPDPLGAGIDPGEAVGDDATQAVRLARLRVLRHASRHLGLLTDQTVGLLLEHGATVADLADASGVTAPAIRQRHRDYLRAGPRVAVVVSRRDRIRVDPDDPRGAYGEMTDPDARYAADRGWWHVGHAVRAAAAHAVVAVDGTVERVYALDPDGWTEHPDIPGKWRFTGRLMTPDAVARAVADGHLPLGIGDPCPTRRGGAYRPVWY